MLRFPLRPAEVEATGHPSHKNRKAQSMTTRGKTRRDKRLSRQEVHVLLRSNPCPCRFSIVMMSSQLAPQLILFEFHPSPFSTANGALVTMPSVRHGASSPRSQETHMALDWLRRLGAPAAARRKAKQSIESNSLTTPVPKTLNRGRENQHLGPGALCHGP